MAYNPVPATDIKDLDDDYKDAADNLPGATDNAARARITSQMQSLATQIEERANKDLRIVQGYFAQHQRAINQMQTQAKAELKNAQDLAAKFKKDPKKTEFVPQVKRSVQKLDTLYKGMKADALSFGQAWFGYRGSFATHVPKKHLATAYAIRSKLMNDQKVMSAIFEQVKGMHREAASLVLIMDKAAMKRDITKHHAAQRPIGDAQQIARDGSAKIQSILADVQNPKGLKPKPNSIASSLNTLRGFVNNKKYDEPTRIAAEGMWKNAEAAFKAMGPKIASMDKLYENTKKALRSNELTDNTVKNELASAAAAIKTAKTDLKKYTGEYNQAKSFFTKWQSGFKSAQKKK